MKSTDPPPNEAEFSGLFLIFSSLLVCLVCVFPSVLSVAPCEGLALHVNASEKQKRSTKNLLNSNSLTIELTTNLTTREEAGALREML